MELILISGVYRYIYHIYAGNTVRVEASKYKGEDTIRLTYVPA
jgi:hypothetical protein